EQSMPHPTQSPLIHAHTRAQALADGLLIDASPMARECGFVYPLALTRAAWHDCVHWPSVASEDGPDQDEAGRLWDVLQLAAGAATSGISRAHGQSQLP